MEAPIAEEIDWQAVRARLARLEEEHGRLRSRGVLALRFNILVIIAIACWLAWPGKTLTADSVAVERAGASRFWVGETRFDGTSLWVAGRRDSSWIDLGHGGSVRPPELRINNLHHGQIRATILGPPSLGLYAYSAGERASRVGPQVELAFVGREWSPRIVLRDVSGQVIWQAP